MFNKKGVMTGLVIVEWQVLTERLHTISKVHRLYTRHKLEWMARSMGTYCEDMVKDFYISYMATL